MAEEDTVLESGLTKTLTPKEYQESFVDFYKQTLGSTGIDVRDDEEEDKKEEDTGPRIITEQTGEGDDTDFVSYGTTNVKGGTSGLDVDDIDLDNLQATSYKDLLNKNNAKDMVDLGDYNITFSRPSKDVFKRAGTVQGMGLAIGMGVIGSDIAGAIFGDERKEVDGKTGFRPSGGLGLMYDLNHSIQTANFNEGKLARQANILEAQSASIDGRAAKLKPEGFYARINGQLVSRKPGSINFDGVYNYTYDQMKNLDAIKRGQNPFGYDLRTEVSSEGGLVNPQVDRGYTEKGTFATINGISAVGNQRDFDDLVQKTISQYGINVTNDATRQRVETTIRGALTKTREENNIFSRTKGAKTLSQNIKEAITPFKTTTVTESDSKDDRVTTTTPTFTAEEVQKNIDADDDFTYDSGDNGGGFDAGSPEADASVGMGDPAGIDFASGGRVGMQNGGNTTEVVQPAGFIAPDPNATDQQEIADDKPMDAKKGDFIINAPAAEEAGKQDIQRMIDTAITNLQEKGVDVRFGNPKMNIRDKVKLLVSRNEVYIPAVIAKEIGYDRLKKINNRGKREVQRRQEEAEQAPQQGMNNGGFIQKKKGDVVEEKTLDSLKIKKGDYVRKEVDAIIKKLPTADALALLMQGEAKNLGDEGLEGAAHVLVNRTNAKGYKNFGRSLLKELTSKYRGKKGNLLFEFNAFEPTKFKESLETFKANKQKYLKVRNIAEDVLAGSRFDFTGGALFFNNPNVKGDEYFTTQVATGNFQETTRTVNKNQPKTLHVYYIPKDFKRGTEIKPKPQMKESFIGLNPNLTTGPKVRIPESKGGSFLFRGSDYERGGATPAL